MHEMSLAKNIADLIGEQVPAPDLEKVRIIKLKVGELSGVVNESLEFSFSVLVRETPLRNAKLLIENVPILASCNQCGATSRLEYGLFFCGNCKSGDIKLISGNELHIDQIEIDD